jgi:hypothetical protein
MDWFLAHFDDLCTQYPGEWLAIKNCAVVAHAATPIALREAVQALGVKRPFVTKASAEAWGADTPKPAVDMVSIPGLAASIEHLQTNIAECRAHPYAGFLITLADAEAIAAALSGSHPAARPDSAEALAILTRWQDNMDHPEGAPLEIHHADIQTLRVALTGSSTPETAEAPAAVSLKDVEAAVKESLREPLRLLVETGMLRSDVVDVAAQDILARLHPQEEAKTS